MVSVLGLVELAGRHLALHKLLLVVRCVDVVVVMLAVMHVRLVILRWSVLDARGPLRNLRWRFLGPARGTGSNVVLLLLRVERRVGAVAVGVPRGVHRRVDVRRSGGRVEVRHVVVVQRRAIERAVVARGRKVVVNIAVTVIILIIIELLVVVMQQIHVSVRLLGVWLRRKLLEVVL